MPESELDQFRDNRYVMRLAQEARSAKTKANEIMDKVDIEMREPTDEERGELDKLEAEFKSAKSGIEREVDLAKMRGRFQAEDVRDSLGSFGGSGRAPAGPTGPIAKTVGEALVKSGVWKAMREAAHDGRLPSAFRSDAVSMPAGLLYSKAAASPLLESNGESLFGDGSTPGPVTTLLPGVADPGLRQLRPTIAALLPVVPITVGNSATYRIAKDRDFPAYPADLPIDEADTKPTAQYEFDVVTVKLTKLAAITKISDEWLEDDAATVAWLNADLPRQLRIVEEYFVAGKLYAGVSDASSLGTTKADKVAGAILAIQNEGFTPDAMVITPTDWWTLATEKFGTGAGDKEYVNGGPYAPSNNPWGLTVVISAAATSHHPLIGSFGEAATLYRKGTMRMDSTNANDDDFENNLITIRVEQREEVGKTYPEAFKTADLS